MRSSQWICGLLALVFFHAAVSFSQSVRPGGLFANLVSPHASLIRIGADALAAGGASIAEKGLASAAFTNPAGMQFGSMTAYAEFGKYETSKWGLLDYNGQILAPAFVSVGIPLENASIGISYLRQYSNRTRLQVIVTSSESPDGTGEFLTYESEGELHSLCGSASLALNGKATVGLTFGMNYFTDNDISFGFHGQGSAKGPFIIAGANLAVDENISIGIAGRYNWSMDYVPETNPLLSIPVSGVAFRILPVEVRFPPICEAGVSWQALPRLKLMGSLEFQNWTTAMPKAENRVLVHVGGAFAVVDMIAFRFGYFTLSSPRALNQDMLDQQFVTFGVHVNVEPIQFSLAMMDSHVFKKSVPDGTSPFSEQFYQTYFASGVSVTF